MGVKKGIWVVVGIIGILIIINRFTHKEKVYNLSGVEIYKEKGEIRFKGRVEKDRGWVQFLIYVKGYKWLKEESAIVSDAELEDIQNGIALIDWKLWDDIWFRRERDRRVELTIEWKKRKIKAEGLLRVSGEELRIEDLIFLGSPYFDETVLREPESKSCKGCPILPLEKETLKDVFVRKSGRSGYELCSEAMPEKGEEVSIILRVEGRG